MKHLFTSCLLVLGLVPAALHAQTAPPMPPAAPTNLSGVALRDWYRTNWYDGKRVELSYATARGKMYNYADNYNNLVTCVYSGYQETVPYSTTNTSTTTVNRINCEHTVPQSWFNQTVRMRSDMHHLYPTYDTWNNLRGSDPYAEIPDAQTQTWMRLLVSQSTIPTTNIAEWSEDTNTQFEPREDHKGNVARSIFYFYTMHANQPDLIATGHNNISSIADINTLYAWHLADPVDAHEIERNRRVAVSQGNYNPYIEHPETVATAWGLTPPGPVFSFATAAGSITEGNTGTSTYTVTLNLAPAATAATTVQVNVDGTNSTATNGTDFAFTSPTTVTFPAGSTSQTVTITVNGDTQPEADETVILTLTNPSTGNSVGSPGIHTLTITNDDGTPPMVNFATATGSIAEGNSGTSTYTVNVTASGTLPTGTFTVPVSVDAANSTATATTDYVLNTTSLTFSNTALTQAITITVNGDVTFEPNETVRLRLGTPSNATIIVGQPNTHTLTILNDDAAPAGAPCTKPYFSQYVEGSATNTKVLEIYNPTLSPMPLAGKSVVLYANGATTPTATQALTGTIAPGDVYVIANTGVVDTGVAAQADIQSNVAFFNGDDAIALFDGTDTLDVIGVIGQRPTEWTVPGGSTLNNTLVRQPTTSQGGRWNGPNGSSTWSAGGVDNYAGVGSYTSTACYVPLAGRTAAVLRNTLEIYPNPASETVQLRLPGVPSARPATIEVLDLLGRPVRQRAAQLSATDAVPVDLRGLPAGIYAIRVLCEEVTYTGRVVVR
ncbi:endonuclease [Hymenobacter properus]|uniref:Endonuclease n=1 Tax=Hymenobacter properus TaxID=2791026 RepID=A0A931BGN8_9BACT|nr:endonuclease [Hymenobacter properus]MBF9140917.1 endonuclease [Hymenobacter properus]MBR7719726.1 endonuclease [Microvirga sp. SRT04]